MRISVGDRCCWAGSRKLDKHKQERGWAKLAGFRVGGQPREPSLQLTSWSQGSFLRRNGRAITGFYFLDYAMIA
jgi:hypothetical protein